MDLEQIMENISEQLKQGLESLSKAETAEEKVAYSTVVRNMSGSLGVFIGLASDMMDMEFDMEDD